MIPNRFSDSLESVPISSSDPPFRGAEGRNQNRVMVDDGNPGDMVTRLGERHYAGEVVWRRLRADTHGRSPGPPAANQRRQVVSVAAGPADGSTGLRNIVVTYKDGTAEQREGSLLNASELAYAHGLTMVPTSDETIRWEQPQT